MVDKVVIDHDRVETLKLSLIQTGANLSEVANGAYVTQNMFLESQSQAAEAMNKVLPVLADCATRMYNCCMTMAAFLSRVVEGTDEWDYEMALKSYLLGVQNTVTQDVADNEHYKAPRLPDGYDQDAYDQGQKQGVGGQIPNLPR